MQKSPKPLLDTYKYSLQSVYVLPICLYIVCEIQVKHQLKIIILLPLKSTDVIFHLMSQVS